MKNSKLTKWSYVASISLLVCFGFMYFVGGIKAQFPADGKFALMFWQAGKIV